MKKLILLLTCAFVVVSLPVNAQALPNRSHEAVLGAAAIMKDFAANAFEGKIEVGLPANRLKASATVRLAELNETTSAPRGLKLVGPLYQVDIPSTAFNPGRYFVSVKSSGSDFFKQLYFYDKNHPDGWRPLPSNENFGKGVVSSYVTIPFARLAVFESEKIIVKGRASWYRHKGGLFAASPDFAVGSRLRVINLDNKKFVDVVVNDVGPNRNAHPDRVVDLDAVAFARLAPLGQGTMRVAVEKLPDHVPSVAAKPGPRPIFLANGEPNIQAKAALLLNSADNTVIWSANADKQLPLASLTKLVAIRVFLDMKPDLNRVVTYSDKDAQLNYKYVKPSESGALRLKDGDTITIKDLVYSSLVGSTNNTVETLIRVSGISRDQFMARMNSAVSDWGTKRTRFIEPTGLAPQNVTTASDYAIIAREVWLSPLIAKASALPSYSLTTVNTKRPHSFKNTNLLAREINSPLLGSKTGFINEAGYCLATKWPTDSNKNIIVIVLGEPNRQAGIDDTKALVAYASKHIQ